MMNLLAELKRRQMFRVAAAYAVVAWVVIQLVNNLAPMLRLPEWAGSFFLVALIAGFPIALIFAWIHELKPEGDELKSVKTGKLDWALFAALIVVIALVSYQQIATNNTATAEKQPGVEAVKAAAASPATGISLAVLPLTNLSGDPNQEFFSDGMTEEITAALAKIPDLRVVARTSAFQFKGENRDIQSIAQALRASHLIEGSVRKAGTRVRITVQLIKAEDGTHIWSENYDRELNDIFAIQEDIARTITTSLRMPLGLKPGENLVNNRSIDPESYQQYLRATAMVRARGLSSMTDATALLEQIVARYPDFAPAWSQLALAHSLTPNFGAARATGSIDELRRVVNEFFPKAEAAAQRAIQLDPQSANAHLALARAELGQRKYAVAEDMFKKALALDPNNPDALSIYANLLGDMGRVKEAVALKRQLQDLETLVPIFNGTTAAMLWVDGQNDAAIEMIKALRSDFPGRASGLAAIYASTGRYREAADALLETPSGTPSAQAQEAARLLRTAPAVAASPESLPRLGFLSFVYLYVGAPDRALELYETDVQAGNGTAFAYPLWHPTYAPLRKTERFKALIRAKGLPDYWRERGWPDLCKPVGANDFACE